MCRIVQQRFQKKCLRRRTGLAPLWILIPMICLFVGMLAFENNIVTGILLALANMFVLYCLKDYGACKGIYEELYRWNY